jgi:hypothetical protein
VSDMDAKIRDTLPELLIDRGNLPAAARALAEIFVSSARIFKRGSSLVKLVCTEQGLSVVTLNVHAVVNEAHALCRPVVIEMKDGEPVKSAITLPQRVASLLLCDIAQPRVQELRGIGLAPLVLDDGMISSTSGFDGRSGCWFEPGPVPFVFGNPTRDQACAALLQIRSTFATFPFADATMKSSNKGLVVDLAPPPGKDESAFLVALLTAVCRPSLPLAPALLIRAPQISGAGTGKGHLARAIGRIAFNIQPPAFTSVGDKREFNKRIESALVEAIPMVFLDNCNGEQLVSNLLAQVLTESIVTTRKMGKTEMVPLTANAFITVTGNGVEVSEDLARRFLVVELDARQENPEGRHFAELFDQRVMVHRDELLAALLTIFRWGRCTPLEPGLPLGSFEQWSAWCRDPLLALGCADPVGRMQAIKAQDQRRAMIGELFAAWHDRYGADPVRLSDVDQSVRALSGVRSRQSFSAFLHSLENTRVTGFVLKIIRSEAKWTAARYAVERCFDGA